MKKSFKIKKIYFDEKKDKELQKKMIQKMKFHIKNFGKYERTVEMKLKKKAPKYLKKRKKIRKQLLFNPYYKKVQVPPKVMWDEEVSNIKDLIIYDSYQYDLKPQDWIKKVKNDTNLKQAKVPYFKKGKYEWVDVSVIGYDEGEKRYEVQVLTGGKTFKKKVNRFSIQFNLEDSEEFQKRILKSKKFYQKKLIQKKQNQELNQVKVDLIDQNFDFDIKKSVSKNLKQTLINQYLLTQKSLHKNHSQMISMKAQKIEENPKNKKFQNLIKNFKNRIIFSNRKTLKILKFFQKKCFTFRETQVFNFQLENSFSLNQFVLIQRKFFQKSSGNLMNQWRDYLVGDVQDMLNNIKEFKSSFNDLKLYQSSKNPLKKIINRLDNAFKEHLLYFMNINAKNYISFLQSYLKKKSISLLKVDIVVDDKSSDKIIFSEDPNLIINNIKKPIFWLKEYLNKFKQIESDIVKILGLEEKEILQIKDNDLNQYLSQIDEIMQQALVKPYQIINDFKTFKFLLSKKTDKLIKKYTENKSKNQMNQLDSYLKKVIDSIGKIKNMYNSCFKCNFFTINNQIIKEQLISQAEIIKKGFLDKIETIIVESISSVHDQYTKFNKYLSKEPQSEKDWHKMKIFNQNFQEKLEKLINKQVYIEQMINIAQKYNRQLSKKTLYSFYFLQLCPVQLQSTFQMNGQIMNDSEDIFLSKLEEQKKKFEEKVRKLEYEYESFKVIDNIDSLEQDAKQSQKIEDRLKELIDIQKDMNFKEEIFEVTKTVNQELIKLKEDFAPYQILWDRLYKFDSNQNTWMVTPIVNLQFQDILEETNSFLKLINSNLIKKFEEINNYEAIQLSEQIKDKILEFQKKFPIIENFTQKCITQKVQNWQSLFEIVTKDEIPQQINLNDLLSLKIEQKMSEVKQFVFAANEKAKLEEFFEKLLNQQLTKVCLKEDNLEQVIGQFRDCYESLMKIYRSQFVSEIKNKVEETEVKVRSLINFLIKLKNCQEQIQKLRIIFQDENLNKKMPVEKKNFDESLEKIQNIFSKMIKTEYVFEQSGIKKMIETVESKTKIISQVQKQMFSYLKEKRQAYPRLYFYSDQKLIDMLSKGMSEIVKQGVFPGVKNIKIENNKILSVTNYEGEELELDLDQNLQHEKTLNLLENQMKEKLKKSNFTQIKMLNFIKQITQEIENNWNNLSGDRLKNNGDFGLIKIHYRDIIENLQKSESEEDKKFSWSQVLKYSQKNKNFYLEIHNLKLPYQYEILKNPTQILLTPLTQKYFIHILNCQSLGYSLMAQKRRNGRARETFKDLGKFIGVNCFVVNCTETLTEKILLQQMLGLAQINSWSLYHSFDRLKVNIQNKFLSLLQEINFAKREKMKDFFLEGEFTQLKNCNFNITINLPYKEIPEHISNCFREMKIICVNQGDLIKYFVSKDCQKTVLDQNLNLKQIKILNLLKSSFNLENSLKLLKNQHNVMDIIENQKILEYIPQLIKIFKSIVLIGNCLNKAEVMQRCLDDSVCIYPEIFSKGDFLGNSQKKGLIENLQNKTLIFDGKISQKWSQFIQICLDDSKDIIQSSGDKVSINQLSYIFVVSQEKNVPPEILQNSLILTMDQSIEEEVQNLKKIKKEEKIQILEIYEKYEKNFKMEKNQFFNALINFKQFKSPVNSQDIHQAIIHSLDQSKEKYNQENISLFLKESFPEISKIKNLNEMNKVQDKIISAINKGINVLIQITSQSFCDSIFEELSKQFEIWHISKNSYNSLKNEISEKYSKKIGLSDHYTTNSSQQLLLHFSNTSLSEENMKLIEQLITQGYLINSLNEMIFLENVQIIVSSELPVPESLKNKMLNFTVEGLSIEEQRNFLSENLQKSLQNIDFMKSVKNVIHEQFMEIFEKNQKLKIMTFKTFKTLISWIKQCDQFSFTGPEDFSEFLLFFIKSQFNSETVGVFKENFGRDFEEQKLWLVNNGKFEFKRVSEYIKEIKENKKISFNITHKHIDDLMKIIYSQNAIDLHCDNVIYKNQLMEISKDLKKNINQQNGQILKIDPFPQKNLKKIFKNLLEDDIIDQMIEIFIKMTGNKHQMLFFRMGENLINFFNHKNTLIQEDLRKLRCSLDIIVNSSLNMNSFKDKVCQLEGKIQDKIEEQKKAEQSLSQQRGEEEEKKNSCEEQFKNLTHLQESLKVMNEELDSRINELEPMLKESIEKLQNIDRSHIDFIKSLKKEISTLKGLYEGLCILFDIKDIPLKKDPKNKDKKIKDFRKACASILSKPDKLMKKLMKFKKSKIEKIKKKKINKLRNLIKCEYFNIEQIGVVSEAAGILTKFIKVIVDVKDKIEIINPLKKQKVKTEKEIFEGSMILERQKKQLETVQKVLKEIQEEYDLNKEKLNKLQEELQKTQNTIILSEKLINLFEEEKILWKNKKEILIKNQKNLRGNTLMLFYDIIFQNYEKKKEIGSILNNHGFSFCQDLNKVEFTSSYLKQYYSVDLTQQDEKSCILNNLISCILVRQSCILDPQNLLINLLTKNFEVLQFQSNQKFSQNQIVYGTKIPSPMPLNYLLVKRQSCQIDQSIRDELVVINLALTDNQIVEDLMSLLVSKLDPSTNNMRLNSLKERQEYMIIKNEIDDQIIEIMSKKIEELLKDDELIEKLTSLKVKQKEIKEKLLVLEQMNKKLNSARNKYRTIAEDLMKFYRLLLSFEKKNIFYFINFQKFVGSLKIFFGKRKKNRNRSSVLIEFIIFYLDLIKIQFSKDDFITLINNVKVWLEKVSAKIPKEKFLQINQIEYTFQSLHKLYQMTKFNQPIWITGNTKEIIKEITLLSLSKQKQLDLYPSPDQFKLFFDYAKSKGRWILMNSIDQEINIKSQCNSEFRLWIVSNELNNQNLLQKSLKIQMSPIKQLETIKENLKLFIEDCEVDQLMNFHCKLKMNHPQLNFEDYLLAYNLLKKSKSLQEIQYYLREVVYTYSYLSQKTINDLIEEEFQNYYK